MIKRKRVGDRTLPCRTPMLEGIEEKHVYRIIPVHEFKK